MLKEAVAAYRLPGRGHLCLRRRLIRPELEKALSLAHQFRNSAPEKPLRTGRLLMRRPVTRQL